jgi:hypothetical protein
VIFFGGSLGMRKARKSSHAVVDYGPVCNEGHIRRSGTNTFHGSVYEFFRNNIFDARNVLQTTGNQPELRQNQYGGGIGGPQLVSRNDAISNCVPY